MDGNSKIAFGESEGGCSSCGQAGGAKKRAASPYNKFVKKEFAAMKKEHPTMSAPSIMKMIAKKWKASHPKPTPKKSPATKKPKSTKSSGKK